MMDDSENKGTAHYRKTIQYTLDMETILCSLSRMILFKIKDSTTQNTLQQNFFSFTSLGFLEPQCTERGAYACVDGWMLSVSGRYFIFNNNNFQRY